MYDERPGLAQHGAKAFGRDLVRGAVSELEPTALVGCEAIHRQAIVHIFARLNTWRRDNRQVSACRKTLRQSTDINFRATACLGKKSVRNVQNGRCLQSLLDARQVPSRNGANR